MAYRASLLGALVGPATRSLAPPATPSTPTVGTGAPRLSPLPPTGSTVTVASPYVGPLPVVVTTSGEVSTGKGDLDWHRSIGVFGDGYCVDPDFTCDACAVEADHPNGADVVVGLASDGASPMGLVCYANAVGGFRESEWHGGPGGEDARTKNAGQMPALFNETGWEMKKALWQLPQVVNFASNALGAGSTVPDSELDISHNHLTLDLVATAQAVMQAIDASGLLGRGLSAAAQSFVSAPSIGSLAAAAPAIVWDIGDWEQASGAAEGVAPSSSSGGATTVAPVSSGIGAGAAVGIGAALLLLLRA